MKERFEGVYLIKDRLATKNLVRGRNVYGERLVQINGEEYRLWNPKRSKLAAAIFNGLGELPLSTHSKCLYLGAASGTTASHLSDIAPEGVIYCIEFSARVLRGLISVCEERKNMIPILGDARQPQQYSTLVEKVDVIYQDVAQPTQADILIGNAKFYLKPRGHVILTVKARSIDVTKKPEDIFNKEIKKLKNADFQILDVVYLEPYEKDHALVLARSKLKIMKSD